MDSYENLFTFEGWWQFEADLNIPLLDDTKIVKRSVRFPRVLAIKYNKSWFVCLASEYLTTNGKLNGPHRFCMVDPCTNDQDKAWKHSLFVFLKSAEII